MKLSLITLASAAFLFGASAQQSDSAAAQKKAAKISSSSFRSIEHNAFDRGESLSYRVHYGILDAGVATIKLTEEQDSIAGRPVLHAVGVGKSTGAFDWFFKVRDRYESYIDEEAVFPWMFVRRVDEGGYKINQDYTFFQHKNVVDNGEGKQFDVPLDVQDMISSFYYARVIDYSDAKVGDTFTIPSFVDDEYYPLSIKYIGKETIKVDAGKFKCMKFVPVVQKGRIFKKRRRHDGLGYR